MPTGFGSAGKGGNFFDVGVNFADFGFGLAVLGKDAGGLYSVDKMLCRKLHTRFHKTEITSGFIKLFYRIYSKLKKCNEHVMH